jgi:hypothetical protein
VKASKTWELTGSTFLPKLGLPVWYEGTLVIFDADTQEDLTIIPIKFIRGEANESSGRSKTS